MLPWKVAGEEATATTEMRVTMPFTRSKSRRTAYIIVPLVLRAAHISQKNSSAITSEKAFDRLAHCFY